MENVLSPLQKRLSPQHKTTKKKKNSTQQQQQQQPLKVVYITNPIKFETTASEFKALVQELTGKNADYSPAESGGGGYQPCAAAALKAVLEEEEEEEEDSGSREQEKMERPVEGGSNPVEFGCGSDSFHSPLMIEDFQGMVDSNLLDSDILQNLLCDNN